MKIERITKRTGNFRVYNVETAKHNNYFANNILVHNCFAYYFKSTNPAYQNTGKDILLKQVNTQRIANALHGKSKSRGEKAFYKHFYKEKFPIHWGSLAEPFGPFERVNHAGYRFLQDLGKHNYPCLINFKGATIFHPKYVSLFEKFAHQKNFAFQVSIVTLDKEVAKRVEVGAPFPRKRIEALRMLSDMGYWTILRLRPFIIGVTDETLDELLEACLDAGIRGISTEFFSVDQRATEGMKLRYRWMAKLMGIKDLQKYYKALSPSERGSFMRLNRFVKEPYIKKIFTFCRKHNLVLGVSDPDFKELCTNGCCCGLPETYPENPGLANWRKSQLTYHLVNARKKFHKTRQTQKLHFAEVYGKQQSWIDDKELSGGQIYMIGKSDAERIYLTPRLIMQNGWNNLSSPRSPRNYLNGKVMPVGTDDNGDLVYKYMESEYECRWQQEGIDLSK